MKSIVNTRTANRRRGQSMVEFALGFSLLLMFTFGIFELGRVIWNYTTVSYAARQGARYAVVRSSLGDPDSTQPTPHPIDQVVIKNAPGLNPSQLTITKNWSPDHTRGSQFTIKVSYPVHVMGFELFLPGVSSIKVSSESTYTILH